VGVWMLSPGRTSVPIAMVGVWAPGMRWEMWCSGWGDSCHTLHAWVPVGRTREARGVPGGGLAGPDLVEEPRRGEMMANRGVWR